MHEINWFKLNLVKSVHEINLFKLNKVIDLSGAWIYEKKKINKSWLES